MEISVVVEMSFVVAEISVAMETFKMWLWVVEKSHDVNDACRQQSIEKERSEVTWVDKRVN